MDPNESPSRQEVAAQLRAAYLAYRRAWRAVRKGPSPSDADRLRLRRAVAHLEAVEAWAEAFMRSRLD